MLFTFITLVQLKRIQACCLIGVVCTNYFLDHTATRRWSVFKSPGRLCFDNEVLGGHSRTTNWRIHFRQLTGNTFHSRNLSTNIDMRWRHGEHSKTKGHKHIKSVSNTEILLQVIKQKGKSAYDGICLQPCCVPIVVNGGKCQHGGGLAHMWQKNHWVLVWLSSQPQLNLKHGCSVHDSHPVQKPLIRT